MTVILDCNGNTITVGARVIDEHGNEGGTVVEITDLDADYDSEYGYKALGPDVIVEYESFLPDGTIQFERESWRARWNATGPWDDHRDDYTCDDVEVAAS